MVILKAVAAMEVNTRAGLHKQPAAITGSAVAAEVGIAEASTGITDKQPATKHTGAVLGEADIVKIDVRIALHPHTTARTVAGIVVIFIRCSYAIIKSDTHTVISAIATEIHATKATATSTCSIDTTTVFSAVTFKLTTTQVKA